MTDVLIVDNHDSFVHTLAGYLVELGVRVSMVEADALVDDDVDAAITPVDAVLVSPGPGDPAHAGASIAVVRAAEARSIPLLGVCLGHQAIGVAFGADVAHAPELRHGETSVVTHDGSALFTGVPNGFRATRYHSLALVADTVPRELEVTARSDSGVIMAIAHREAPIWGVQFHPESILTEHGYRLLGNWLEAAGFMGARERGRALQVRGEVTDRCTP